MNKKRLRALLLTIAIVGGTGAGYMWETLNNTSTSISESNCLNDNSVTSQSECLGSVASVRDSQWTTFWATASVAILAALIWWLIGTKEEDMAILQKIREN